MNLCRGNMLRVKKVRMRLFLGHILITIVVTKSIEAVKSHFCSRYAVTRAVGLHSCSRYAVALTVVQNYYLAGIEHFLYTLTYLHLAD